jgi:chromosomal replication initiator protein
MIEMIDAIARKHGTTAEEVLGPSRLRWIVVARKEAIIHIAFAFRNMSTSRLGKLFNRDHSTIVAHLAEAAANHEASRRTRPSPEMQAAE